VAPRRASAYGGRPTDRRHAGRRRGHSVGVTSDDLTADQLYQVLRGLAPTRDQLTQIVRAGSRSTTRRRAGGRGGG
jgi:hypothetical protein